jgi:hypothetical protein
MAVDIDLYGRNFFDQALCGCVKLCKSTGGDSKARQVVFSDKTRVNYFVRQASSIRKSFSVTLLIN